MEKITQLILEEPRLLLFLLLFLLVLIAVLATAFGLLAVVTSLFKFDARRKGEEYVPIFRGLWKNIDKRLTNAVPLEREQEVALHNYDGILELDNHLPPWWLAMFYLGIVFGVVYMVRYHILETAPLSGEEYQLEMAEAKADIEAYRKTMALSIDESNVELMTDAASLSAGAALYKANCVTCHGPEGQGLVGPNLTDSYWIHGGSIEDVFKTVKYGVSDKGMRAWQDMLSPQQMAEVSSFVLSIGGTKPPNPKDPQGEKYEPEPQKL